MSSLQAKHIQVCCRIRGSEVGEPTVTSYLNNEGKDGKSYEVATSTGSFQMDYAFDNGDSQDCIFEQIVQPMLSDAFTGFNCSLFSYGQTGSGKTYTLIGNIAGGGSTVLENKDRGIIPRAAEEIFNKQAALDPQKVTCQIKLAILEVYQEQLKDLIGIGGSNSLSHSSSRENLSSTTAGVSAPTLKIREQIDGTVWVEGLTELVVTTPVDFNRILMNALKRRVVGAHAMNDTSSRSHFCCILNVHQVFHTTGVKINSKIHFIDLAGSEMVRKTDTSGVRFDEAKHINKSLSALGNVIYALSAPAKGTTDGVSNPWSSSNTNNKEIGASLAHTPHSKTTATATGVTATPTAATAANNSNSSKAHIPYRDSKLTRLLQNSLGGNAKTVIILTISDAKKHLQETLSTLRFGARARSIVIKPIVNKIVLEDQNMMKKQYSKAVQENRDLQDLVAQLQAELHSLRGKQDTSGMTQHSIDNHHPDAVCEVCSNFLDLKLRNGKDYTPYTQPEHTTKTTKPTTTKEPPVAASKVKANLPALSTINIDTAVSVAEYEDNDYGIPEPLDRCAICGLSSSEAEKLEMYTGEMLGEMFSCDGNCGHQFHVRCVGLLGEGGQFALPEGEWFCTECYSDTTTGENDHPKSNKGRDTTGIAEIESGTSGDDMEAGDEIGGRRREPDPSRLVTSSQDLYTLTTDPEAVASQSHRIAPNKTPSSVLATIKAEYHTMRKERNRILAQWQTEKKIIEKYEITRRIEQQKRDQELVNAKQMIVKLEDMVTQGEKQSERMQKLFDVMLKELQQSTANFSTTHLSPKNNSSAIRNSVDRLKWASMTVESLLEMPLDSLSTSKHSPTHSYAHTSDTTTSGTKVSQLQHSNSSPTIKTVAALHTASTMQLATEAVGPYANTSAGIPKPWTGKVRTGANTMSASTTLSLSNTNTISNTNAPSPNHNVKLSSNSGSERSKSTESQEISLKPPRYSTDPSLKASAGNNTHATHRNSLNSQDARDYSGGGTVSSIADSDTSRRSSFHSQDSNESSPDNSTSESNNNNNNKRKLPENLQQDISGNKGKSKFINPLKNRLKDLLKSVEAETDAFAEIRQKFKSREDERNLLRSSQGDR